MGLPQPVPVVVPCPVLPGDAGAAVWNVQAAADTTAASLLDGLSDQSAQMPWRLRDTQGRIFAPHDALSAGMGVQVDVAGPPSTAMVMAKVNVPCALAFMQTQVSNEVRRSVAAGLGPWMTDDLVAAGLHALQPVGCAVWADPVVLTACFQCQEVDALPSVALCEG